MRPGEVLDPARPYPSSPSLLLCSFTSQVTQIPNQEAYRLQLTIQGPALLIEALQRHVEAVDGPAERRQKEGPRTVFVPCAAVADKWRAVFHLPPATCGIIGSGIGPIDGKVTNFGDATYSVISRLLKCRRR